MLALEGGETLTAADRKRLRHPALGGVILFARNFSTAAQLRQLTASLRRAAGRDIVIAADQEGGRVQRFCENGFSVLPPASAFAQTANGEECARAAGTVMAAELIAAGVDLSFAPVLDLRGRSRIIGERAFSENPRAVFSLAHSFALGMREAGMQCCGKHFPGHGAAAADSHKTLPVDKRKYETIAARDLTPFAEWAKAKMPALMTAHIVYSECDNNPATYSRFWLREVLRRRLNFGGLTISDDLSMAGADIGGIGKRLKKARAAGCDLFLICSPENLNESLAAAETPGNGNNNKTRGNNNATNNWLPLKPTPTPNANWQNAAYNRARKILKESGLLRRHS